MQIFYEYMPSPVGLIEISADECALTSVNFVAHRRNPSCSNPVSRAARHQLEAYFAGKRRDFELQLAFNGTEFQKEVWMQLLKVPFGRTASYRDIAVAVGKPQATRAVGSANGRNPIAIVVPCHRIIGSNGHLTGYGSGLWRKEWLLKHEGIGVRDLYRT